MSRLDDRKQARDGLKATLVRQPAVAAVSADEASQLKSTLTPLGGERAGNKDGSIPAWSGAVTKAAGARVGDIPVSLFPGEKPVVQISAAR